MSPGDTHDERPDGKQDPFDGGIGPTTDATATRAFAPARIVALTLIGLLVAGLLYLRFATGEDRVSVPRGAHAGQLTLKPCTYATEKGGYAADCGTLVVPENRTNPQSRLIALPVKRIRARTANPAEPIFRLQGGPGVTNMEFTDASRFADARDVVLVGYRGVDGSVKLDCPEVTSALRHSSDALSEKSLQAYADGYRFCANRLTRKGVDLPSYGLVQQVDDLEAARVALRYPRVDLISESAGTRTALIYAWRYPASVHRSVMIGVNPPGNYMWDPKTIDEQIARYAALCAKEPSCSARTDDLSATIRKTASDMPGRWAFLPIKKGNARIISFFGLMESTSKAAPASAPMTIDAWLSAAKGDASGFWFASLAGDFLFPRLFTWGQYAAAGSIDVPAARHYFASASAQDRATNLGYAASAFAWGGGRLADAWPRSAGVDAYQGVRKSQVETLLVGGNLDFATPPQFATKELLPALPNGHQVILRDLGHTVSFWNEQPPASSHLINTFLDSGRVDDSLYAPTKVDFTPSISDGGIAKFALTVMLALAALTVLWLLWMWRRVRKRGHFGRRTGPAVRALSPILLGLGGWCIALIIVLIAFPSVPIDDELMTVLAVGVPSGLGVYLAWVNRDWSLMTKGVGLAAAAGGALLGAWLGFNATGVGLSILTAIVGAAAGANLLLLALEIVWDRQRHDRFVATGPRVTWGTRPSGGQGFGKSGKVA